MWALLAIFAACLLCRFGFVLRTPQRKRTKQRRVMVVLGSGGHTSEMFGVIEQLHKEDWAMKTVQYVVSATDRDSQAVAEKFELDFLGRRARRCAVIPRAREVGQSYFTSIFTTLRAFGAAILLVFDDQPDAILTNGPGVCIPIVVANLAIATLFPSRQRATMSYFESFTCVDHLSVSGKIMLYLADVFTVQWPELAERLRGRRHVHLCGPLADTGRSATLPALLPGKEAMLGEGKAKRTCIVTVGSTKFDALIAAADAPQFYSAMADLGINDVFIQKGRSDVEVTGAYPTQLMTRTVVDYLPGLAARIRGASLVISHAGAGTILEALGAGVPTVVVPNEALMSNHQVQLAKGLADRGHLAFCFPSELHATLNDAAVWRGLRAFPRPNAERTRKVVVPILE